ncbi:replication-relaxation family protein [Streptomyces erythrochromogenes]|uniref:replication-relaxation family protein n=1 Tax=Streptomyces erythrochromogenes TaxID=285574 RepID=UPI003402B4A5
MGKYGSTTRTRALVLEALGVVKVATAAQLRDLTCPGTADPATVRGGCKDLEASGLVVSAGTTSRIEGGRRITEKLWSLTPAGLEAAAHALERPVKEMGGTARAAAASGAKHALRVTETLAAFVQQPVEPTERPVARTRTVPRQAPLRRRPPGLGPLSSWSTEVVLPTGGTFTSPARGSLRADAVFALPGAPVPLLFLEVDNGTETRAQVADKLARYSRFFARTDKSRPDTVGGRDRPLWRTVWTAPDGGREQPHPPVAIVFTKAMGPEAMDACMRGIAELSAPVWQGDWHPGRRVGEQQDGFRTFQGRVPVVACRLDRLQADGPHGPIWWRYGRKRGGQTLTAALDNEGYYSRDAYQAREAARRRVAEEQAAARKAAAEQAREASRWPCPACGKPVYPGEWGATATGSPCYDCQRAAFACQEQEREDALRAAEQEELERQRRQDGWLGWLRT